MMNLREHEFPEPDAGGRQWCKHCGARRHEQMTATCLERPAPDNGLMPEPKRRVPACEDDSIAARIAELRKEREPEPPPAPDDPA